VQEAAKKSPEQIKKFSNLSQRLFILSQSIFCDPGLPMRPKMRYFSIPSILFMHASIVFLGAATLILWNPVPVFPKIFPLSSHSFAS
jgi:hypothetical protein